jgi:hypothetical protein
MTVAQLHAWASARELAYWQAFFELGRQERLQRDAQHRADENNPRLKKQREKAKRGH